MGALTKAAAGKGMAQQQGEKPKTLQEIIKYRWSEIEAVMPKHLSSERLYQMTVSAINREPKLGECELSTILSCVMKCSALGLEPSAVDGLGRAYILPFFNNKTRKMEATFILGYKGMIDLARRSGEIESIASRAVYEGDEFEYEFGLDEKCRHIPHAIDRTPDKLTHVYVVAKFKDGGYYVDVMTKAEVDGIRKRSKAGNSGPWVTDYEAMAKKTVIRRAFPYLPVSVEAQGAASADETSGGYEGTLGYAPVITPEEPSDGPETTPMEVQPESVEDAPADEPSRAACRTCGNVRGNLTPDCTIEDLNAFQCCEKPDYEWA